MPRRPDPEDEWNDDDSTGDVPYLPDGLLDEEQPWRGLEHPANWPDHDAGPEYWLNLIQSEEDEDEEDDEEGDE